MRLTRGTVSLILGNKKVLDYLDSNGLDVNKLNNCEIELMGKTYVFLLDPVNKIEPPRGYISLDGDRPDVILALDIDDKDNYSFKKFEKTYRILKS